MNNVSLLLLAESGLGAIPPDRLRALADWCWDAGTKTSHAHYFVLWRIFGDLAAAFEEFGSMSQDRVDGINAALKQWLPLIRGAEPREALRLSLVAFESVREQLG